MQRYYSRFYYLLLTNLLHVLVVRPSSSKKIYIGKLPYWKQIRSFWILINMMDDAIGMFSVTLLMQHSNHNKFCL
jgi:hypothetical protein